MMTKNRQGVHPQDFLHYPQVVMKGSLPIDSMKVIEEILILIKISSYASYDAFRKMRCF